MVAFNVFNCRAIGPNGFLDFLLYNLPLGIGKTHWPTYILIGLCEFAVYYVVFYLLITKLNLKTLGREDDESEMKLHSKAEYLEKASHKNDEGSKKQDGASDVDAALIVEALGGKDNIQKVDSCFTRLRLVVKDSSLVDEATLKNDTGAMGIFKDGETVQVVYGLGINKVRGAVDAYLGNE